MSLQIVALLITIRVGELLGSLAWPVRIALLIPVVLVLFGIADIVSDKVDERVQPGYASQNEGTPSSMG
jgi:hypothetical protein